MAVSLWFSGVRLYVQSPNGQSAFPAVSGQPSAAERGALAFTYSTRAQGDKDRGPIPAGNYVINTSDIISYNHTKGTYLKSIIATLAGISSPATYLKKVENAWGKMPGASGKIIPILAQDGTAEYAFGRNRCWIHGSDFPGSIGCIDLTSFMDLFLQQLQGLASTTIPLRVVYGLSPTGPESRDIDRLGNDISRIA